MWRLRWRILLLNGESLATFAAPLSGAPTPHTLLDIAKEKSKFPAGHLPVARREGKKTAACGLA
jgi:hypothetical protein